MTTQVMIDRKNTSAMSWLLMSVHKRTIDASLRKVISKVPVQGVWKALRLVARQHRNQGTLEEYHEMED